MSKFDEAINLYKKTFVEKLNRDNFDEDLLKAIAKSLGPSIYNKDAAKVACSDKVERKKIKDSFLIKKLGLENSPALEEAIDEVCKTLGSSNRSKYRVVFYYLLVEKFKKQELFVASDTATKAEEAPTPKTGSSEKTADGNRSDMNRKNSEDIIRRHSLYAAGAGLVPIPLVDLASISVVQYKMIKKLAAQYSHVTFDTQKAKSVIAALTGGFSSFELGLFTRMLFKGIPFFGPIIGGTAMSGFAYASTQLIGEIFDDHFASGGNFSIEELTMQKMKEAFNFEKVKERMSF